MLTITTISHLYSGNIYHNITVFYVLCSLEIRQLSVRTVNQKEDLSPTSRPKIIFSFKTGMVLGCILDSNVILLDFLDKCI